MVLSDWEEDDISESKFIEFKLTSSSFNITFNFLNVRFLTFKFDSIKSKIILFRAGESSHFKKFEDLERQRDQDQWEVILLYLTFFTLIYCYCL